MRWGKKITGHLDHMVCLMRFIGRNFIKDDCPYRASALAFVTILAIVPALIVVLSVLSTFPAFQNLKEPVQEFILANFVPTTGKLVELHINEFLHKVTQLSIFGVCFLLLTVFLMMFTIERSMNTIWRVRTHRKAITAVLLYWGILSFSPIFVGLSLVASSCLASLPLILNEPLSYVLLSAAPCLLSFLGFTFLYFVVPNHPVKLRHAITGGIVTTLLFESVKLGFAYYLTHYPFYQLLYGAFAIVPIFLIWIYWVWLITLLGAEITYALSIERQHLRLSK